MGLRLISKPEETPVSLDEAKMHLRVDGDDENDLIKSLIEAATDYCDGQGGFLGRALMDQTWELVLDSFPAREIKIPLPPLIEVVSIKYDDGSGAEQTLSETRYTVDATSEPGWVLPVGSWPSTFDGVNAVRIQFRCGYLDQSVSPPTENVPASIKAAIKLILGHLYANRENVVIGQSVAEVPLAAETLLRRYRLYLSMA
jgi:uncharacterized phiE125 gp8 family phage protein